MALVSRPHFSITMLDLSSHVTRLDRFNAFPTQRVASRIALWHCAGASSILGTHPTMQRSISVSVNEYEHAPIEPLQNDRHMS
jgi:hypothetical protein